MNKLMTYSWIILGIFLFSCNSSRKFNYESAYRFSLPKKSVDVVKNNGVKDSADISLSNEIMVSSANDEIQIPAITSSGISPSIQPSNVPQHKSKKVLIQELKTLRKDLKSISKIKKHKSTSEVKDGYFLRGLLLMILGLTGIILSIMFFSSLGTVLAAVIAAVGLILFLMGLLGLVL